RSRLVETERSLPRADEHGRRPRPCRELARRRHVLLRLGRRDEPPPRPRRRLRRARRRRRRLAGARLGLRHCVPPGAREATAVRDWFGGEMAGRYDGSTDAEFADETIAATADFLAELAGDGAALELGIGTGRIALPLAARGVRVAGIDLSPDMVAQLRR